MEVFKRDKIINCLNLEIKSTQKNIVIPKPFPEDNYDADFIEIDKNCVPKNCLEKMCETFKDLKSPQD
jgi:hypothetical protein